MILVTLRHSCCSLKRTTPSPISQLPALKPEYMQMMLARIECVWIYAWYVRLLEQKLAEAKSKKDTLKARAQSAKTSKQVQEMVSGVGTSNSLAAFERMEEKVRAFRGDQPTLSLMLCLVLRMCSRSNEITYMLDTVQELVQP